MNLEIEKIKSSASYLVKNIGDLHMTKFLKLMYYLDFISVLETGHPVTNDTYYHLPYGPVPTFIKDNITSLKDDIKKEQEEIIKDDSGSSFDQVTIFKDIFDLTKQGDTYKIVAKVDPDLTHLSPYEIGLLEDIVKEFKTKTARQLVEKTHSEAPYMQTSMLDVIDYKLAFHLNRATILPSRTYLFSPEVSQAEYFNG